MSIFLLLLFYIILLQTCLSSVCGKEIMALKEQRNIIP